VLNSAVGFENPNFAGTKARTTSSVVNRLLLTQEHRASRTTCQPFRNGLISMIVTTKPLRFARNTLSVRMNIIQPNNGQALSPTQDARPRYTGERLLRERPRVYRQIIRLLSEGISVNQICKLCHVTRETVRVVERREAAEISARKKSIIGIV
jgi:hypothetical protein